MSRWTLARCLIAFPVAAALAQSPPPSSFPGDAPEGPAAGILDFSSDADSLSPGESTTLRWEAINAFAISIQPDIGIVSTRGSEQITPAQTTTYRLEALGSRGSVVQTLTIEVAGTEARDGSGVVAEQRPVPRLADGHPDLSGLYIGGRDVRLVGDVVQTAAGTAASARLAANDLGQGVDCLPPGVPGATTMPFPMQIVHTEDTIAIMYEAYHLFRIVPVGRAHADYLAPAWMGHSVARWDGDTLVIDVAGFNDRTLVAGRPHSEDMRVEERYTRSSFDTIDYEAIVRDPAMFAEPVRYAGPLTLRPEWEIGEYLCTENNRDYDELPDVD